MYTNKVSIKILLLYILNLKLHYVQSVSIVHIRQWISFFFFFFFFLVFCYLNVSKYLKITINLNYFCDVKRG